MMELEYGCLSGVTSAGSVAATGLSDFSPALIYSGAAEGEEIRRTFSRCLSFQFAKEYYTPYSQLHVTCLLTREEANALPVKPIRAELKLSGKTVHQGVIQSMEIRRLPGKILLIVHSRSHTSLLSQTELEPGIYPQMSLNKLLDENLQVPFVTHENLSGTINYVYIAPHASLWDAVVNLCLKQEQIYPYLGAGNEIRFHGPASPKLLDFYMGPSSPIWPAGTRILSSGKRNDYSAVTTHMHMADVNNAYTHHYIDDEAIALGVQRHRYIAVLDRQWLSDPTQGLKYRVGFSMRGMDASYVTVTGYHGQDLGDLFRIDATGMHRIHQMTVTGNASGVTTRMTYYKDRMALQ